MKFRITRYERASGNVFYEVEKGRLMWWPLYKDREARGGEAGRYRTREAVLALIDEEVAHFKDLKLRREGSKIVKTTVDYITKEF